ncbi:MAG: hypothetical protein Q9191_003246 [Dirinaria sp. TL-2023a]
MAKKSSIFSFFALRIMVVAACVCKLVFWNRLPKPTDPTIDTWSVTICTQIIQCLSISCACCLYLKPFLDSVESGLIRSDDMRRRGSNYKLSSISVGRGKNDTLKMKSMSKHHNTTDIQGGSAAITDDVESLHSRAQIINKNRTFAPDTSPVDQNPPPWPLP